MANDQVSPQQGPSIDPQSLQTMFGGQPQAQAQPSALPPTSPVQAPDGPPTAQSMMQAVSDDPTQQYVRGAMSNVLAGQGQFQQQQQGLMDQLKSVPYAQTGPHFGKFDSSTGEYKHAGILHNIGQALLMAAEMTRPGQALEGAVYGPGVSQRAQKISNITGQLEQSRQQEEAAEKPLQPLAQFGGRAYGGAAGVARETQKSAVGMAAIQQHADAVKQNAQNVIARLKTETDINAATNTMRQLIQNSKNQVLEDLGNKGFDVKLYDTDADNMVRLQIGNMLADPSLQKTNPLLSRAAAALGFNIPTPSEPGAQAPAGYNPPPKPNIPGAGGTPGGQKSAAPQRPQGVPANAVWNPKVRRWQVK